MARTASPFSAARMNLDAALDKLKKYAEDPEWRELPNFQQRIKDNLEASRVYFGKLLEMVQGSPVSSDKKAK